MTPAVGRPFCRGVTPSVPSELAWVLNLLTQTARYAEPALDELDASHLPGVKSLRAPTAERARRLWSDSLAGCPELLLVADQADCVNHDNPERLFSWLTARGNGRPVEDYDLLTEPAPDRHAIRTRLRLLKANVDAKRAYRDLLGDVWQLAARSWSQRGRDLVSKACIEWQARLDAGSQIEEMIPPRHPLTHSGQLGFEDIFTHRSEFGLSPLYFCLSGGHIVDLVEMLHISVPASDLLPVRKVRDAAFVADRLRVLAEPSRVHILIQLLSAPAGVMDVARVLSMSQPTVSGHLKALRKAGLVEPRRAGSRTMFVASRKRIERLLEDARATMARWD